METQHFFAICFKCLWTKQDELSAFFLNCIVKSCSNYQIPKYNRILFLHRIKIHPILRGYFLFDIVILGPIQRTKKTEM